MVVLNEKISPLARTRKEVCESPILYASKQISIDPIFCAYVGDDLRDIVAANAAKMFSVAAAYGFISDTNQIKEWESDYIIDSPLDLKNLIS